MGCWHPPGAASTLTAQRRLSPWQAWDITKQTFAYTNHTVLPEALSSEQAAANLH